MRRDRWFLIIVIALLLVFVSINFFTELKVKAFWKKESPSSERERLRLENEKLRTEIALLSNLKDYMPQGDGDKTVAFVYSRYPFNLKSEILVNKGGKDGIKNGQTVFYKGLYLGKVKETYDRSSLVQTIFDSRFESAIKIGGKGIDALLKGGDEPRLDLIPKNSEILEGDAVYSTAPDVPYGVSVGDIRKFEKSGSEPFAKASLRLPYSISDVSVVEILIKR